MEVPRHWRIKKQRYALVGEICPQCASALFPPRAICPVCAERTHQTQPISQRQPIVAMVERMQPAGH